MGSGWCPDLGHFMQIRVNRNMMWRTWNNKWSMIRRSNNKISLNKWNIRYVSILLQNHPQRHIKRTFQHDFLHYQVKCKCWLEQNSHFRDSGPLLYLLSQHGLEASLSNWSGETILTLYECDHYRTILRETVRVVRNFLFMFLWGWFCNRMETLHILTLIAFKSSWEYFVHLICICNRMGPSKISV